MSRGSPGSPYRKNQYSATAATVSTELGRAGKALRRAARSPGKMALLAVNTGCRDAKICGLR
jgi:hypothetical protein